MHYYHYHGLSVVHRPIIRLLCQDRLFWMIRFLLIDPSRVHPLMYIPILTQSSHHDWTHGKSVHTWKKVVICCYTVVICCYTVIRTRYILFVYLLALHSRWVAVVGTSQLCFVAPGFALGTTGRWATKSFGALGVWHPRWRPQWHWSGFCWWFLRFDVQTHTYTTLYL